MKKRDKKYFIAAWTTLNKRPPTDAERAVIDTDYAEYEHNEKLPLYVEKHREDQQRRVIEQRARAKRRQNQELRRLVRAGCRSSHQDIAS